MMEMVLAFLLDWAFGDPPNRWHPVAWLGRAIDLAERLAPRSEAGRFLYGMAIVGGGAASLAAVMGWVRRLPTMLRVPTEAILLKLTISPRGLADAAESVASAIRAGDLEEARRLVGWHLVSRDTSALSLDEVSGAAVESVAENLTDGFVAPFFYYAVGGLPAAWAYRFVNTCDSMLGYRDERHEWLGKAAARADDASNLIPARLAGASIVAAAALLGFDGSMAWKVMRRQHGRTSSPNAGWTMSAAAGALRVTLGKRGSYSLEGGSRRKDHRTIEEAVRLMKVAASLDFLFTVALAAVMRRWKEERADDVL